MSSYFDDKELFVGPKTSQYGSHMIMTDVQKPKQVKYVNVDTRFRDDYKDSFEVDYTITLNERITDVKSIYVTHLELPISFYNISDALGNNVCKIGSTLVTVPDGNYDATSLASYLNGLGGISFAISNNKSTFTTSDKINFDVDKYGGFKKFDFKLSLGWLLGFRKQEYEAATNPTSEGFVNLNGPRYLYLTIDEFNSKVNRNTLTRIQLDNTTYPFGSVMPANVHNGYLESEERTYSGKNDLLKIRIKLINEFDKTINLNGDDISFVLRVEYV